MDQISFPIWIIGTIFQHEEPTLIIAWKQPRANCRVFACSALTFAPCPPSVSEKDSDSDPLLANNAPMGSLTSEASCEALFDKLNESTPLSSPSPFPPFFFFLPFFGFFAPGCDFFSAAVAVVVSKVGGRDCGGGSWEKPDWISVGWSVDGTWVGAPGRPCSKCTCFKKCKICMGPG